MEKQKLDILIDKSILGTLTQNEQSALDAYIIEKPSTKLEIKMRTDILKGLEFNADQELKSILEKIHTEEILNPKRNILLKRIGIAAFFLVLIIGAYSLFNYNSNVPEANLQDGQVLYASYFQPYAPSLETRDNIGQNATYKSFIDAYRAQDYQKGLETIKPHLPEVDNNMLLLAGISAMEIDKPQEALTYLNKIILSNDFYFIDHAKWYKSLVLIKTDKINEAKQILNELATNPKADHYDESISLLQKI